MESYRTPYAAWNNLSDLRGSADIVEEVDAVTTYLGFCQPGTGATSDPKWSIMRIEQSGAEQPIITEFKWAEGRCSFDLVWNDRATYNYKFRNF